MEPKHRKQIGKIIGGLKCPKDFTCYKSGLDILCKAKDIGMELLLVCLEEKPRKCKFALYYKGTYYCQCPLRVYISKKLKK